MIKKLPKTFISFDTENKKIFYIIDGVRVYKAGFVDKINELVDAVNLLNKKLKK